MTESGFDLIPLGRRAEALARNTEGWTMVPFALVLLAPVIVNIFMFHFFLAPAGLPIALVVVAFEVILAWMHRDAFAPPVLQRTRPSAGVVNFLLGGESTLKVGGVKSLFAQLTEHERRGGGV